MTRTFQCESDIYALPSQSRPYFVRDGVVSKLLVRVGAGGMKTFVMRARFGQAKAPATRKIGDAFTTSLESARKTVIRWSTLNRKGVDPREEATRAELEAEKYQRQTFRHVLQDYIATLPFRAQNRKADEDGATLRREFLDPERVPWLDDPIRDVKGANVQRAIEAIRNRGAPTQAYNVFSLIKTFFRWATTPARVDDFGMEHSPVERLKSSDMGLKRNKGTRKHDSREIRAYWVACDAMDYPFDECCRALIISLQRKNETRLAVWSEFDMEQRLWTIPACRFKNGKCQLVPLSVPMMQLLARIRSRQSDRHGPFVFSRNDGHSPMGLNSGDIDKFRAKMTEIYLADNPGRAPPQHWTLHDNRRTGRSALSNLGVPFDVAEAVIGHMKEALEETYNLNSFKMQRRHALHLWAEELKFIIDDPSHSLESEENEAPEWDSRWNQTRPRKASK